MAIDDMEVKEAFESFDGDQSEDSGAFSRTFFVEGVDLNYPQAPLDAISHKDIPDIGHKLTSNGYSYFLKSYDYERGGSEDMVIVTANYETRGSESEDDQPKEDADNKTEEEKRRRQTYKAPFNERLEYQSESGETMTGLDVDTYEELPLPKKIEVLKGVVVWKFDVLTYPYDEYYLNIGNINGSAYPDVSGNDYRPFYFNPKNLLYMGASASEWTDPIKDNPDGDAASENIPSLDWAWKHEFTFAFRRQDWDVEKFYLTKKEHPIRFETGQALWYYSFENNSYEKWLDSYDNPVTGSNATAEMPLLHAIGGTTSAGGSDSQFTEPYSAVIAEREPVDFSTLFDFYWEPLGNTSTTTTSGS